MNAPRKKQAQVRGGNIKLVFHVGKTKLEASKAEKEHCPFLGVEGHFWYLAK